MGDSLVWANNKQIFKFLVISLDLSHLKLKFSKFNHFIDNKCYRHCLQFADWFGAHDDDNNDDDVCDVDVEKKGKAIWKWKINTRISVIRYWTIFFPCIVRWKKEKSSPHCTVICKNYLALYFSSTSIVSKWMVNVLYFYWKWNFHFESSIHGHLILFTKLQYQITHT